MTVFDDKVKKEIKDRWNRMTINPDKLNSVKKSVAGIIQNKDRYKKVEAITQVPWYFIALIHSMESGRNFGTHLHNGDPLTARTVQVPKGRPLNGLPPFTWEDSAIDALTYDGITKEKDWSIEHILYLCEKFNGFGYRNHQRPSQYVWSFTNIEEPGRYVKDGVWNDTAMSDQVGCASMLSVLLSSGEVTNGSTSNIPDRNDTIPSNNSLDNNVVRWVLDKTNPADVRGYNATGKCICYLDTGCNFDVLLKSIAMISPTAKYSIEALPPKPPVVVAPPKTEPKPTPKPVLELKNGVTDPAVIELKKLLNEKFGASLTTTGSLAPVFGDKTEVEVKRVQAILNIPADGVIHATDLEMILSYQKPEYPIEPTVDFSSTFEHLKNVKADAALSLEESAKMWSAMQAQIQDKIAFNTRVNLGVKQEYGNAQCATTTASVLEGAAIKAGLLPVAERFSKVHRDKDEFALTHQIEIMLKRLGFVMYPKSTHIAPQGAIGLMANRYDFAGCKKHSGHVYSIYEDKGINQKDVICDNGGWNHTYVNNTESFFVPSGIKVQKREVVVKSNTGSNAALIDEEKKWIGVKEKGGNNKGPEVEKFQKAVDNKASSEAWCMAFQMFCIKEVEAALGIKSQIFRSEHCLTVWQKSPVSMRITKPEAGCVIIWQHGDTTSGHTGIFTGFDKNGNLLTIEGNTNSAGSNDGDGVFAKVRNPVADGELKIVGFLRVFS